MTEKKKLPQDLISYTRGKIAKRLAVCAALMIVFGVLLLLFGDRIVGAYNPVFRISFYVIVMLLPLVFTGVPYKLMDRTYFGKVTKVDIQTTTDTASPTKPTRESLYKKNTIYLTVVQPDGKKLYKKVYEGKANAQQKLNSYQKEDMVFHLYGTEHTIVLPKESDSFVQCAVCGTSNEKHNETCRSCGHTLIKTVDK